MLATFQANKIKHTVLLLAWAIAFLLLSACAPKGIETQPAETQQFKDCENCPAMIQLPPGSFLMGTAESERLIDPRTGKPAKNAIPQHRVNIEYSFAIASYETTAGEFSSFIAATGYKPDGSCMEFSKPDSFEISSNSNWNDTGYAQSDNSPVVCVSYFDARAYVDWLSSITGAIYRLPTEAEWEYAARANTTTPYFWGTDENASCQYANVRSPGADSISTRQTESDNTDGFPCDDGFVHTSPVGSFSPNGFGLYDMQGNTWEWVIDCNHKNYEGAPEDGSAWLDDDGCQFGVIRSGSFINRVERSSTTVRAGRPREGRATNMGFRVVKAPLPMGNSMQEAVAGAWGEQTETTNSGNLGAQLFSDNCQACHINQDDFRGVYGTDKPTIEKTIRDGGNNIMSMPAFGELLSDSEISALADYIRRQNNWTD